jgi:hypothetical protein
VKTPDIVALIVVALVGVSFWKLHRDKTSTFNLFDLVMEGGRLSRMACVFMGAFAVCSWIMIRVATEGKMTDGYMLAYGGLFVAPIIAKMFSLPPAQGTTTTTTTATDTSTQTRIPIPKGEAP